MLPWRSTIGMRATEREEKMEIDGEQNEKQLFETMTEKTDKQAGGLRQS